MNFYQYFTIWIFWALLGTILTIILEKIDKKNVTVGTVVLAIITGTIFGPIFPIVMWISLNARKKLF